ncbi:hypothetical protein C8J56DRAFT_1170075 [Mycena floridula]|nr:hypothetical protein C8J56DRAFT_1170075 [Mycena floridula]
MSENIGSARFRTSGRIQIGPARKFWCFRLSFRAESAVITRRISNFSFSLDFLRPDCPIPAGKHHSSPSTTRSLPKYTTFIDDWAFKRFFATNREIFSEFDKPNFLQFVQSGGLIHDTLFHFGTVLVVKRHVLSDCLSLLVSLRQV